MTFATVDGSVISPLCSAANCASSLPSDDTMPSSVRMNVATLPMIVSAFGVSSRTPSAQN